MKRVTCRCGQPVDTFTTDYGRPVRLDTTSAPITTDLDAARWRLWEDRGPRIGWCVLNVPQRTWRELRLEHECAHTERKHKSKRHNIKENTL